MSYDPKINIEDHSRLCAQFGIPLQVTRVSKILPNKEPEPKLWLSRTSQYLAIRKLLERGIEKGQSALLTSTINDQKNALLSVLLDTRRPGRDSTKKHKILKNVKKGMMYEQEGRTLRYRCEVSDQGSICQQDYTEKTELERAEKINDMAYREEIERGFELSTSLREGFKRFKKKVQQALNEGSAKEAISHSVNFDHLFPKGGYLTARTSYFFVTKHPKYNFLCVFESCEDIMSPLNQSLDTPLLCGHKIEKDNVRLEYEFEMKQIWGDIPSALKNADGSFNQDAIKDVVTAELARVQDMIFETSESIEYINISKAEMSRESLSMLFGSQADDKNQDEAPSMLSAFAISIAKPFTETLRSVLGKGSPLIPYIRQLKKIRGDYNDRYKPYQPVSPDTLLNRLPKPKAA